jgi:hypothetical protein
LISNTVFFKKIDHILSFYKKLKPSHFILLISFLYFIRILPLLLHPTLWAEDANIFYGPLLQEEKSFRELLFSTYNGQYWTFQFIVAKLLIIILNGNILYLPFLSTLICVSGTYVCALLWINSQMLVKRRFFRLLIFSYVLLGPSAYEPLGTLCGLHNYLLLGLIALSGWSTTRGKFPKIVFLFFGMASIMSSVNGLFLIGMLLTSRHLNKKSFILPITISSLLVGFQIRDWSSRAQSSVNEDTLTQISNTFLVVLKRISAELIFGEVGVSRLSGSLPEVFWVVSGLVPIILYLFLFTKLNFSKEKLIIIFIPLSFLVVYFGLVVQASKSIGTSALANFGSAGRYFMVIHVIVFITFLIIVELLPKSKTLITQLAIYSLTLLFLSGCIFDFRIADKSSIDTRSSWNTFAKCFENGKFGCSTIVPPGHTWGIVLK